MFSLKGRLLSAEVFDATSFLIKKKLGLRNHSALFVCVCVCVCVCARAPLPHFSESFGEFL